jgi:acetyltransferase-like isoleucine patch superfamily enzyme
MSSHPGNLGHRFYAKLPLLTGKIRFYLKRRKTLIFSGAKITWTNSGWLERNVRFSFFPQANVHIGQIEASQGSRLVAEAGSKLTIGHGVFFNRNCTIVCKSSVTIGENTLFGEGVKVFDHDHVHRPALEKVQFVSKPIQIGNGCWIGSNVVILKGVSIGDNVTVGANLVIREDIPADVTVIAKQDLIYIKK